MKKLIHKDPETEKMTFSIRDMKQIFDTLHAYEETGLTPEQIESLKIDKLNLIAMVEDLEKIQAERDAAIDAIYKIAERGTTWMCPYCKNAKSIYDGTCDCSLGIGVCRSPFTKFEWRGEKLEDSYYV